MAVQISTTVPDIDDVRVIDFAESIDARITQKGGRLQEYVDMVTVRGKAKTIDQYGGIELVENNGLFPQIEEGQIAHDRRQLTWKRYTQAILVDEAQIKEIIEDPQGKWAGRLVQAYNRLKDRLILAAVRAAVDTGETGATSLTAAQDGVLTVDATAGLTYEKLLEITENYIDNSVYVNSEDEFGGMPALIITGAENTKLMTEAEFTNQDYSQLFQKEGMHMRVAGDHRIITYGASAKNGTNGIVEFSGSTRYCISMVKGAVTMGVGVEPTLRIDYLPERHNTIAIKFSVGIGTVRNQGELCQIVTTTIA